MFLGPLAASLLLSVAANPPSSTTERCPDTRPPGASREGSFTLRCDDSVEKSEQAQLLQRAQRAWSFDAKEYSWSDGVVLLGQVEIWILPDCTFSAPGHQVGARTIGRSRGTYGDRDRMPIRTF